MSGIQDVPSDRNVLSALVVLHLGTNSLMNNGFKNQKHMIKQVFKGLNNENGGAKPSISGKSGGGLTRSNSFKAGSGSHSNFYAVWLCRW
ncbi:hypothetical protein L1987_75116 [Smallanthus sonchifolius]|uniref:Uncharacterized protein n=1 Tax=Smallanthus sonchifolius TaxID=185202 RepID=A0ACB9A3S7_9ASTR|nr:hypothetical protein L1987_75116 [Smallanthus sonchifolius]